MDRRAFTGLTVNLHLTARLLNKAIDLTEAKPCSTVCLFGCKKWIERFRNGLTIHPNAGVRNGDQNMLCRSLVAGPGCWFVVINSCGFDCDCTALRHRITGVHDEIQERVLKFRWVGFDKSSIEGEHCFDSDSFPNVRRSISAKL